jgi:hypothetical protein
MEIRDSDGNLIGILFNTEGTTIVEVLTDAGFQLEEV